MKGEGLTPEQAAELPLPSWNHPFKRDEVIRVELENLGYDVPDYRSYFPGWGLFIRYDLIVAAQKVADLQQGQPQQQGEEHG